MGVGGTPHPAMSDFRIYFPLWKQSSSIEIFESHSEQDVGYPRYPSKRINVPGNERIRNRLKFSENLNAQLQKTQKLEYLEVTKGFSTVRGQKKTISLRLNNICYITPERINGFVDIIFQSSGQWNLIIYMKWYQINAWRLQIRVPGAK